MNESDDLIAHYCKIAPEEKKTILSADKDLLQLVNENTTIYSPIAKVFYTHGKKVKIGTYEMPACNILPYKIITGDKSDNINGIYYFGEKTLIKYFPEFLDKPVNINDILIKAKELLSGVRKFYLNDLSFRNYAMLRMDTGLSQNIENIDFDLFK